MLGQILPAYMFWHNYIKDYNRETATLSIKLTAFLGNLYLVKSFIYIEVVICKLLKFLHFSYRYMDKFGVKRTACVFVEERRNSHFWSTFR